MESQDALKKFGALIKSKKSIRRIKKEILATAMDEIDSAVDELKSSRRSI